MEGLDAVAESSSRAPRFAILSLGLTSSIGVEQLLLDGGLFQKLACSFDLIGLAREIRMVLFALSCRSHLTMLFFGTLRRARAVATNRRGRRLRLPLSQLPSRIPCSPFTVSLKADAVPSTGSTIMAICSC